MDINLVQDYKGIMISKIKNSGLTLPPSANDEGLIIKYINYLRKKAFAGPHKVVKSSNFNCPSEVSSGLAKLENVIEKGGDITPYFNRTASNLNEFDDLFSDWGVLHFHLGEDLIEGENLVTRGEFVLFAYINNDTVYLINIYDHHHWTDYSVIQEMYNNWPELIEPFIIKGAMDLSYEIPSSKLRKIREKGSTTFFKIKNENGQNICLMPPGWGLNTARTSVLDTRIYDDAIHKLRDIESYLKRKEHEIKKDMVDKGISLKQELKFEMIDFEESSIYLIDKNHDYTITVGI